MCEITQNLFVGIFYLQGDSQSSWELFLASLLSRLYHRNFFFISGVQTAKQLPTLTFLRCSSPFSHGAQHGWVHSYRLIYRKP
jgi:hypothetical protein